MFVSNKIVASGIAAGALSVLNLPILVLSYAYSKRFTDTENLGSIQQAFLFVFHPRSNIKELLWLIILTPGYAFILTYTMDWGMFYMSLMSSYSMLGEPIPEITPYMTDKDFHLFSH